VRATFGPANHDRLARIKAVSDPTTSSPHNANIKCAWPDHFPTAHSLTTLACSDLTLFQG
jgi:hypothetical protein